MKRYLAAALLLLMVCLSAAGMAQISSYTYGGSDRDYLSEIAVSGDGRILMTGYTMSVDGALAGRTKSGRTGWALCVNAGGEILWSFCSRNGEDAWMDAPVFHEDGTATVLLYSGMGADGVEIIRLDEKGNDVWRREMIAAGAGSAHYAGSTPLGYVVSSVGQKGREQGTAPYNWSGERIADYDDVFAYFENAEQGAFVLDDSYGTVSIMRQTGTGAYESFVEIAPELELDGGFDLCALAEGGVFGYAQAQTNGGTQGRILCWNAQGEIVYDMMLPEWCVQSAAQTRDGMLLLCHAAGFAGGSVWVANVNAQGILTGAKEVPREYGTFTYGQIAALPDGRAALLGATAEGEAPDGYAVLAIVKME